MSTSSSMSNISSDVAEKEEKLSDIYIIYIYISNKDIALELEEEFFSSLNHSLSEFSESTGRKGTPL